MGGCQIARFALFRGKHRMLSIAAQLRTGEIDEINVNNRNTSNDWQSQPVLERQREVTSAGRMDFPAVFTIRLNAPRSSRNAFLAKPIKIACIWQGGK
jgi:hypothetical protein